MARSTEGRLLTFGTYSRASLAALAIVFLVRFAATQILQAQTYQVIHNFGDGADGAIPSSGLTMDASGNLYGTSVGYSRCCGTIFQLSKAGSNWILTPLYEFHGGWDGDSPWARVVFGPDGSLYGTTLWGGNQQNGTVFKLSPPTHFAASVLNGWIKTTLYRFAGSGDGGNPQYADLIFDQAGNMYGTTISGGDSSSDGTVFEMSPSTGGWTKTTLYTFQGQSDGSGPAGTLVLDGGGNLYGTTYGGGNPQCLFSCGTVFELTPSSSGWTELILYRFQGGNDGGNPVGGVTFGGDGYLYGTTSWGGSGAGGTVFSLNGRYSPYPFTGNPNYEFPGPWSTLASDFAGNFYGTTLADGTYGSGTIFQVRPSCGCGGCGWNYDLLHEFTGGSDGGYPYGGVTIGADGELYGTASAGGSQNKGVVWQITPAQDSRTTSGSGCNVNR